MARVLDYPSLWQARRDGIVFGPAELTIGLAPFDGPKSAVLLAAGRKDMLSSLVLTRVDKDHVRLSLMQNDTVLVSLDAVADPAGKLTVRIEAPWLYPPPESPYWDRFPNALERRDRQTRFALACGGRSVAGYSEFSFDATRFEPFELGALEGGVARIAAPVEQPSLRTRSRARRAMKPTSIRPCRASGLPGDCRAPAGAPS
jgi:hypothetical protein